jgi:hypothetical protein
MNRNSPATLSLLIASLLLTAAHVRAAEPTAFQLQVTGQGDPVIFIPGFTCPGSVWDATVDKIKSEVCAGVGLQVPPTAYCFRCSPLDVSAQRSS